MKKYLNPQNSRFCMNAGLVVCLLLLLFYRITEMNAFLVLGFLILGVSVFQLMFFYKCPYCKKDWDYRAPIPKFCPHCGHEIEEHENVFENKLY